MLKAADSASRVDPVALLHELRIHVALERIEIIGQRTDPRVGVIVR